MNNVIEHVLFHTYGQTLTAVDICNLRCINKHFKTEVDNFFTYTKSSTKVAIVPFATITYIIPGKCISCNEFTNTKYELCNDKPYMCRCCIRAISLTPKEAYTKWHIPVHLIESIPAVLLNGETLINKDDARNLALEYHKGPTNLLIACNKMAKYKRHKQVLAESKHLLHREMFMMSDPVKKYISSGKGGLHSVKEIVAQWIAYVQKKETSFMCDSTEMTFLTKHTMFRYYLRVLNRLGTADSLQQAKRKALEMYLADGGDIAKIPTSLLDTTGVDTTHAACRPVDQGTTNTQADTKPGTVAHGRSKHI